MHQELARVGHVEQRVAAGGHLAQARADHDQQVGRLDGGGQRRIDADAGAADVAAVAVVDVVLVAERRRDRQIEAVGEGLHGPLNLAAPARPADDHQRALGGGKLGLQQRHVGGAGLGARQPRRLGVGRLALRRQHVLGQAQHHGAGPAGAGHVEGVAHVLGDALGLADHRRPLHERGEQLLDLDLLERLAVLVPERRQADERTIGVESCCATCSPAMALAAPGPRVTKQMPGSPGDLAPGLRHHRGAALLAADDGLDAVGVVQAVERRQEALARHRERRRGALGLELIDQNLPAVAHASPLLVPVLLSLQPRGRPRQRR